MSEEERLQRTCMQWNAAKFHRFPLLSKMFHPANGGARSPAEAGILKACGVKPGVPDLLLPFPTPFFCGLSIELKAQKGRLSREQRRWLMDFHNAGYLVGVVRTLEEYENMILAFHGELFSAKRWPGSREIGGLGAMLRAREGRRQMECSGSV
jgi:hypothetical protein